MQAGWEDRLAIVETVNNWALWRDAGDWERFRGVWHEDGWMTATWFQGPAEKFIEVSRAGYDKGVSILHFLGGTSVDLKGERAVAQTKMTISQRAPVDGVVQQLAVHAAGAVASQGQPVLMVVPELALWLPRVSQ